MARREGISGVAVLLAISGAVLVTSGLKNASVADTLRAMIRAEPIPSGPSQVPNYGTKWVGEGLTPSVLGEAVATTARSLIGVPYRWAGNDPATGLDCSGLVNYCLRANGVTLPNSRPVSAQYLVWSGARTLPREAAASGDLVCWASHIGIATGRDTMVNAPRPGTTVREERIWGIPTPTIRRPKAYYQDEVR